MVDYFVGFVVVLRIVLGKLTLFRVFEVLDKAIKIELLPPLLTLHEPV